MPASRIALTVLPALLFALPAQASCVPSVESRASLEAWKAGGFEIPDDRARNARALALVDCLGHADPFLRDGIAFEALSTWMRGERLDTRTLRTLAQALPARLEGEDADGFRKPFAALVLSEVARSDRVNAWMTPEERGWMVDSAAAYLRGVRDYRGYVDGEGWRHGVAHGADWAMQLVLNEALQPAQVTGLLGAVGTQVMPANGHAYAFGEPARLARPVVYAVMRGDTELSVVEAWLDGLLASLGPMPAQDPQAGWWIRRTNLEHFLRSIGHMAGQSDAPALATLRQQVTTAVGRLP